MSDAYHQLLVGFRQPAAACRPMMFWVWNGRLEPDRIRRQVADLARKGCGGFFIHPMGESFRLGDFIQGMPGYLSEEFFAAVRVAVEAASDAGLYAWLYDEGGWPSGTAQGQVLEGHPEHTAKTLVAQPPPGAGQAPQFRVQEVPGRVDLLSPAAVRRFMDLTHERYAASVGEFFGSVIPGIFTDEPAVPGRVGTAQIPWTDGLLEQFRQRRGFDLEPLLAALFNAEVVGEGAHERLGAETVAQVRCEFCDLWTDRYQEAYWRQINDWCAAHGLLHTGHVGGEDDLREHGRHGFGHFFKTAGSLHVPGVDAIWRQLWWGQENQDFPRLAASAARRRPGLEGVVPTASPFDHAVITETNGAYGLGLTFQQMRWLVDYHLVRGVNLIAPMSYSYETSGGRLFRTQDHVGPDTPSWELYDAFSDYVGRLCAVLRSGVALADVAVHYPVEALWQDPEGEAAETAAQSFEAMAQALQEQQVAFDVLDATALVEGTVSEGVLETPGESYATVVVPRVPLLPRAVMERLAELYRSGGRVVFLGGLPGGCSNLGAAAEFSAARDALAAEAVVMDAERDYAGLGGDTVGGLDEGARWDGMAAAYIGPRGVDRFPASVQADRAVLIAPGDEIGRLARLLALRAGRYGLQPAGIVPHLRALVRQIGPLQVAFLMNDSLEELAFELEIVSETPALLERWEAADGTARPLLVHEEVMEVSRAEMSLEPAGSALLVLSPLEAHAALPAEVPTGRRQGDAAPVVVDVLPPPRRVYVVSEYRVVEGGVRVWGGDAARSLPPQLGDWQDLGLQDFSGTVAYEFTFSVPAEYLPEEVFLDLGEVCYSASLLLNGEPVRLLWPPYIVPVGGRLQAHGNTLTVHVTNTLANQVASGTVVAEAQRRGWLNSYYQRALPMMQESLRSGLFGPVSLCLRG